jgi:hypothetical protein
MPSRTNLDPRRDSARVAMYAVVQQQIPRGLKPARNDNP